MGTQRPGKAVGSDYVAGPAQLILERECTDLHRYMLEKEGFGSLRWVCISLRT